LFDAHPEQNLGKNVKRSGGNAEGIKMTGTRGFAQCNTFDQIWEAERYKRTLRDSVHPMPAAAEAL
jgi:hypothetical protein